MQTYSTKVEKEQELQEMVHNVVKAEVEKPKWKSVQELDRELDHSDDEPEHPVSGKYVLQKGKDKMTVEHVYKIEHEAIPHMGVQPHWEARLPRDAEAACIRPDPRQPETVPLGGRTAQDAGAPHSFTEDNGHGQPDLDPDRRRESDRAACEVPTLSR